jgi:integrase
VGRAIRQRTHHQGIYHRDTPRGRVYDFNYRAGGKLKWESAFPTLAEARARREEVLYEARRGGVVGSKTRTFKAFVEDDWLPRLQARVAQGDLRASTEAQYARDVRLHLVPAFGPFHLDQIGVEQVERFRDKLTASGLSNDSVRRIVNTLGYSLKLARKWRLIAYNPVADAEKPKPRRRTPDLPTLAQIEELADSAPALEFGNLIRFAAYSGPRISELFALRWASCDLTEGAESFVVVEQFYKGELVPTAKTRAGSRQVLLASQAAEALRQQSMAQQVDARPNPHGLVFPSPHGSYWRDSNFNRRVWQPTRKAAGLPDLLFHTLRYFYVSTVRAQGLATAITEQLVGHTDDRTHRGYTRPIAGTEKLIRTALAAAFTASEETSG